jgi:hypothetical protein
MPPVSALLHYLIGVTGLALLDELGDGGVRHEHLDRRDAPIGADPRDQGLRKDRAQRLAHAQADDVALMRREHVDDTLHRLRSA